MKIPDSSGATNHTIPVSNGLLRPPHVERIGPAFPLFLKFEDMVTDGNGRDGLVHGGTPVKDERLARSLGIHPKTLAIQRRRLERHGYIKTRRTPYGLIVRVMRSKKWALIRSKRGSKNTPSVPRDEAKLLPEMERFLASDGAKSLHVIKTEPYKTEPKGTVGAEPRPLHSIWKALRVEMPIGHPAFQGEVEALWDAFAPSGVSPAEIVEQILQERQSRNQRTPKQFYDAKHRLDDREQAGRLELARTDAMNEIPAIEVPA